MKKISILLATFLVLMTGCNSFNSGDDPQHVLTAFFKAISKKDVKEAKKYVTEDSQGMISLMEMSMGSVQDSSENMEQFNPDKINIGTPNINGEEATVPVTEKASGETVNFFLKKEKGQWKVAFDMGTLMRMAQEKMKEKGVSLDSMMNGLPKNELNEIQQSLDSAGVQLNNITPDKINAAKKALDSLSKKIPAEKLKEAEKALEGLQKQP